MTGLLGSEQALQQGLTGSTEAYEDALKRMQGTYQQAQAGSQAALQQGLSAGNQALTSALAKIQSTLGSTKSGMAQAYNQGVGALNPFAKTGQSADALVSSLLGGQGMAAQQQAMQQFQESPATAFLREQGEAAVLRNAAATGGLRGGNVMKELNRFGTGLANQSFNERIAQLQQQAASGLNAASNIGQLRGQQAGQIGQLGSQAAGIMGQFGQQQYSGAQQAAAQQAGLIGNIGSQLGGQIGQMGSAIGQNIYGTGQLLSQGRTMAGQNLADIASKGGQMLSELLGQQGTNIANLLGGTGQQQGALKTDLAALLANIATGAGSQVSGLPSIPGVTHTPGMLGDLGSLAGGVGTAIGAVSDIRLKRNIKHLGTLNGINLYSWDWTEQGKAIAGDQPTVGVIAQEHPHATIEHESGYLMVDYSRV